MYFDHPQHFNPCRPSCVTRCVGTFARVFRLYETSNYNVHEVCSCCGREFEYHRRFQGCPHCGWGMPSGL